jgi:hypothetical protein
LSFWEPLWVMSLTIFKIESLPQVCVPHSSIALRRLGKVFKATTHRSSYPTHFKYPSINDDAKWFSLNLFLMKSHVEHIDGWNFFDSTSNYPISGIYVNLNLSGWRWVDAFIICMCTCVYVWCGYGWNTNLRLAAKKIEIPKVYAE